MDKKTEMTVEKVASSSILRASLKTLFNLPRSEQKSFFDESMRNIALSIPLILNELDSSEVINKAKQVTLLVAMAREIMQDTKDKGLKDSIKIERLS